jgi:EPS-associated MarR family transcriptional regulator
MANSIPDEIRYKLLSLIQENPHYSQRELAEKVGVSVGKVNYCIKALVDVGYVKLNNFKSAEKKSGYMYFLTPKGMKEKLSVTLRFLEFKQQQYDEIKKEINILKSQVDRSDYDIQKE